MEEATTLVAPEVVLPRSVPRRATARIRIRVSPLLEAMAKATLLFAIAQVWIVQGYRVYGSCMEPSLATGERLLGSKLSLASGIHRGDVVVFQPPHKPHTAFIKRVIGLPGETVEIRKNHVFVDGKPLNEPYLRLTWHDERRPEKVPHDMVYVLGDNRDNSNDSRMWGQLPIRRIQAKAWFRYWPPERVGFIH
jgi:signal peptidase I